MPVKPNSVDEYLAIGCGRCKYGGTPQCKVHRWESVLAELRAILNSSELSENIKWSAPCYTYNDRNILSLSALKDCAVVSFFRGAQLTDPEGLLEKPGPNSRFARYLKFTDTETIVASKATLLNFVSEAIALSTTGEKARPSSDGLMAYPEELIQAFESSPDFEEAFHDLTPGRQRGYLLHFTSAKQSRTRSSRIEKCKPAIFAGKGWNER